MANAPARRCGNCAAFVPRNLPPPGPARDAIVRTIEHAGQNPNLGFCHLEPVVVQKEPEDFCLQFSARKT